MKIDTRKVLTTIKGENYKDGENDLTLGEVLANVLTIQKTPNPWKQYRLSNDIAKSDGELELSAEDIVFLKKALEDNAKGDMTRYFPVIIGQAIDMLEPGASK